MIYIYITYIYIYDIYNTVTNNRPCSGTSYTQKNLSLFSSIKDENKKGETSDKCEENIIKKSIFLKNYILEVLKHY